MPRAAPWILLVWLAGGLISSLAVGRQGWILWRRLADREDLDGPARVMVDDLRLASGYTRPVRVTTTDRLTVPIALGLFRPEICLPRQSLGRLSAPEQRAMLAHELAHLVRRDPAWLLTSAWIETLFFFQPLNRLASRRLRQLSEVLCDDWAVARTGSAASLARCLTEVAGWAIERPRFFPSPGIAGGFTELGHRIERLVEGRGGGAARVPRSGLLLASLAVWGLVGAIVPGWSAGPNPMVAEAAEEPPAVQQVPSEGAAGEVDSALPAPIPPGDREESYPIDRSWVSVPLLDALRDLASVRGLNFVIEPGVSGTVTAEVTGVPWHLFLEQVLLINNLVMTQDGAVWRIAPREGVSVVEPSSEAGDEPRPEVVGEPKVDESAEEPRVEPAPLVESEEPPTEEERAPAPGSESEKVEDSSGAVDSVDELEDETSVEDSLGEMPPTQAATPDDPVASPEPAATSRPSLSMPPDRDPTETAGAPSDEIETPPVVERLPRIRFPKMAIRLNKWRATVTLRVMVDEKGRVIAARPVGEELGFGFEKAAIRVAQGATYQPARRDGIPVAAETTLMVSFERRR